MLTLELVCEPVRVATRDRNFVVATSQRESDTLYLQRSAIARSRAVGHFEPLCKVQPPSRYSQPSSSDEPGV